MGEDTPDIFSAGLIDYASGGKDGVISGILDELSVTHEKNRIILGRGKLLVSGYPVLFEGKEVIGISSDYANGAYMLVGVLKVSGRVATSFHLSVRVSGNVKCDDVLATGEGIVEVIIADFVIKGGKITQCVSALNKIVGGKPDENASKIDALRKRLESSERKSEARYCKIIEGSVDGNIYVKDAQKGYFDDFRIYGGTAISGKWVNCISNSTSIVSRTKNCFDYDGFVLDNTFSGYNKVFYASCSDEVCKENNGYTIEGAKYTANDYYSVDNGLLRIDMNTILKGEKYTVSFDLTAYSVWEENSASQIGVEIRSGNKICLNQALSVAVGENKHHSLTFEATSWNINIYIYVCGCKLNVSNIQIERGESETEYSPYVGEVYPVQFKDKEGNSYYVGGISDEVVDVVYMENGAPVLLKKTGRSNTKITDAKPGSTYKRYTGDEVTENGEITVGAGEYVVYELNEYKKIELDPDCVPLDKIKTYEFCTEVRLYGMVEPRFTAKYGRNLSAILKKIEDKLLI